MSKTDDFVFHFTGAGALLSIVTQRQLWATDAEYLNDKFEGQLPSKLLTWVADNPEAFLPGVKVHAKYLKALKHSLNHGLLMCTVSFSEHYRSLPQYRMYCPPAGGYAIGFRKDYLSTLGLLVTCDYSRENLWTWCREYARDFFRDAQALDSSDISPEELGIGVISSKEYIKRRVVAGLTYKSDEFINEKEHRLIVGGSPRRYRESAQRNAVIPYVTLALPNDGTDVLIAAGPNREPGYAGRTIGSLQRAAYDAGTNWKFSLLGTGEFGFRV